VSSVFLPSTSFGPVQPLGERSTIIGHARPLCRRLARAALDGADLADHRSSVAAIAWCISCGISPSTKCGGSRSRLKQAFQLSIEGCAPAPSGWRSCSRSDAGSAARAVADGIEELVRVPGAASGPGLRLAVADHAGGDQSGLSKAAPKACDERIAELTPLVDRAGVSGATWLPIPPGKENCLNSRACPLVRRDLGYNSL
jgi:hypothetical protein